ncbi:MAG: YidC/Oxa1 family insertase periplasmic-domain containing protein, partial [Bacteroidia bacterium]|nr:YidC/Oxa1 family insertase periplasmic-domain containing protein [Bacteroidia bacterium]
MDKNSITGIVLIGLILFGFTWYQSKQYQKQAEYQAQLDSIARVEALERAAQDSVIAISMAADTSLAQPVQAAAIYKDSLLEVSHTAEAAQCVLENDKVAITFTTKGAQPYSVRIKDYLTYEKEDLLLFRPGDSEYAISIYTGEYIKTSDFVFNIVEQTASTVVMRLPFSNGGYIEQKYTLEEDAYSVKNELSFVGMQGI